MDNLHDVIAEWRKTDCTAAKLRTTERFRKFVAEKATSGDLIELLRAIDNRGFTSVSN